MKYAYYTHFAQAYGEGNYSACTYNNSTSCTSSGSSGSSSGSSSGLADTGFDILLIATLACLLIFIGLVVRIVRKKLAANRQREAALATVEAENDEQRPSQL